MTRAYRVLRYGPLKLAGRLFEIFQDPPSWMESGSAGTAILYLVAGAAAPVALERVPSYDLITDIVDTWAWYTIMGLGGVGQLGGLLFSKLEIADRHPAVVRFVRLSLSGYMCVLYSWTAAMIWPKYPAPGIAFILGWAVANVAVVARHVRDW